MLCTLIVAWAVPCTAETLRDPTQPHQVVDTGTVGGSTKHPMLTSVLIAKDRRVAVIDGVTLMEGSRGAGMELIEVSATGALVRKDGRIMRLTLSGANMTKERR